VSDVEVRPGSENIICIVYLILTEYQQRNDETTRQVSQMGHLPFIVRKSFRGGRSMPKSNHNGEQSSYLEILEKMIQEIQYGTISVIVQDGKVIQIDKTEKIRLKS
jgi:hypothetical protein